MTLDGPGFGRGVCRRRGLAIGGRLVVLAIGGRLVVLAIDAHLALGFKRRAIGAHCHNRGVCCV